MRRKRLTVALALPLAILACTQNKTTLMFPTRFSDNGVAAQNRIGHYLQESVVGPKLRSCWSQLQGEGAIAMDFTYRKSGDSWAFDRLSVTKSTLAKGQDFIAQQCMADSARATAFPVDSKEGLEMVAEQFVVRLSWPVPLPAVGAQMSSDQIARMTGTSGGGLGDVAGCSECVSRTEYPYGLKCESRASGGHLDCREHSTNVCSTAPTACLRGTFSGTSGVVMY